MLDDSDQAIGEHRQEGGDARDQEHRGDRQLTNVRNGGKAGFMGHGAAGGEAGARKSFTLTHGLSIDPKSRVCP
jgi:hypothetical protein